jgi:hypothetical protein
MELSQASWTIRRSASMRRNRSASVVAIHEFIERRSDIPSVDKVVKVVLDELQALRNEGRTRDKLQTAIKP